MVSPESILIGKTLKQVGFRARFDAAVIGLSREGKTVSGKLGNNPIQSGDKLMLAVGPDFERRQNISRNFFLLSDYKTFQPLSVVQNTAAIAGFLAAIAVGALGIMSLIESLMLYLVLMVGSKVADSSQLRRRFPFELLTILVCALSLASAVQSSGLATSVTQVFLAQINGLPTVAVLLGLILLTVLLTETMTNTAAAALMVPIALSIADGLQLDAMPWVMAVAYGASACFISPFGYQTNLMVMSVGEYRPADFIRVGWPVTLVYITIVTVLIPLVFPFHSV
ncbi:SLC13 family permease [Salinivibrio socompensis]|uniref:SLC13 family permease n=1 Tax=Salinivibrio socompensis TaxID=1510206 RepID=UPI0004B9CE13|nr:SLC13 family permease [Salinivibrio socompensis]